MAYCTREDLETIYGKTNIKQWADGNNNMNIVEIAARIAWAVEKATADIDDRLRNKQYTVPFATVPTTIRNLAAQLAAIALYETPRAMADGDGAVDIIAGQKESAEETLQAILTGAIKLPLTQIATRVPEAVPQIVTFE